MSTPTGKVVSDEIAATAPTSRVLAAVVTIVAARLYWRGWSNELRRLLRGEVAERPEYRPILRDMRELAAKDDLKDSYGNRIDPKDVTTNFDTGRIMKQGKPDRR